MLILEKTSKLENFAVVVKGYGRQLLFQSSPY